MPRKPSLAERRPFRSGNARRAPLALDPRAESELYEATETEPNHTDDAIAVVTITGPLEHHEAFFWDSYESILERAECAFSDDAVKAVVLKIDSPGGDASGMVETHKTLREMRAAYSKPLFAYANECASSAGYGIACAADKIYLPESAHVGSVGVIATVIDETDYLKKNGIRVELITTGARKGDGHPAKELDADVLAALQAQVDAVAAPFFEIVANARGMSTKAVKALEAGVFTGKAAVDAGLADAVAGWADFLQIVASSLDLAHVAQIGSTEPNPSSSNGTRKGSETMTLLELRAAIDSAKTDAERTVAINAYAAAVELQAATKYKKTKETEEEETTDEEESESEESEEEKDDDSDDDDDDDDDSDDDDDKDAAEEKKADKKAFSSKVGLYTSGRLLRLAREVTGKRDVKEVFGALEAVIPRLKKQAKLEQRVKTLEEDKRQALVSSLLSSAMREGKITKAQASKLRSQDESWLRGYLADIPKRAVANTLESGGHAPPELNASDPLAGLDADQRRIVEMTAQTMGKPIADTANVVLSENARKNGAKRY